MKKRVLALIPARAGSKGIKGKNLKKIDGRSLIYYAVRAARKSRLVERIIVSTDSNRIAREAIRCGADVPFLRPKNISGDKARMEDAVIHALNFLKKNEKIKYDGVVLLQPTSPLRSSGQIDEAVSLLFKSACDSVVSVSKVSEHPVRMITVRADRSIRFILKSRRGLRRQDLPSVFKIDGSVYAVAVGSFMKTRKIVGKNTLAVVSEGGRSLDIDDATDLALARMLMKRRP